MNKKAWFISIGCLLLGMIVGGIVATALTGMMAAKILASTHDMQIVESGNRAFKAYQHEDRPVAIYALNDHLAILQEAETNGAHDSIFLPGTELQRRLMFTHARLAKLLTDNGQSDMSMTHVTEALKYAQETDKDARKIARFLSITNQSQLFDIVSKFDQKGAP
jgi:hypothetical protein